MAFRYCSGTQCLPTDFVYVRNPTGNGFRNDNVLVFTLLFRDIVHAGDTVVWTYRDSFCDRLGACPGHAVCFESDTPEGDCGAPVNPARYVAARTGPGTISYTVPPSTPPGTLLRYFCPINDHFVFGMTGTLLGK